MGSVAKPHPRLRKAVREILIYGFCCGILITILRLSETSRAASAKPFMPDGQQIRELGITARELEILGLIAAGLSNREIADRLFVSENTVKTHSCRLFDKLGARRRTQAVQLGKQAHLIP